MTNSANKLPTSLLRIVFSRIMIAALLAIALQFTIYLAKNIENESHFAGWFLKLETQKISRAIHLDKGQLRLKQTTDLDHYNGKFASAYAFRVFDAKGQVIASRNEKLFPPPLPSENLFSLLPDLWLRQGGSSPWLHLTGGQKHLIASAPVWIEIATKGDPAGLRHAVFWMDVLEDVWIPVLPTIFLLAIFSLLAVRSALHPFQKASLFAEKLPPSHINQLPFLENLPLEARRFSLSINKLLERYSKFLSSQQLFFSEAVHELRTPLAVMILEMNKIPGPRARRVEGDIELMTDIVNRLLGLVSMDAMKKVNLTTINLVEVVTEVSNHLDPLVQKKQCTLLLRDKMPDTFEGERSFVRDAIVNLLENAIKHSPQGAKIIATCGPGHCVTIEDNGPGFPSKDFEKYFSPFYQGNTLVEGVGLGLAIAKKSAEFSGGHVQIGTSRMGGALVQIFFKT
ncbi:MAG: HAMP domain-containing histidine kinase [Hyphomicrobiaceae bacterium]|nr:HAMP domain-containing histidine kinase [Hyphomicrobiaceae bacterium]